MTEQAGQSPIQIRRSFLIFHWFSCAGAFKTPSLYNSASLLFSMHDGAFSTMQQVIAHYNRGGDAKHTHQDDLIEPLNLTDKEQTDLIAFMQSLTDPQLNHIHRPQLP